MHIIQQKLLKLVDSFNLGAMPLRDIAKIINLEHPQLIKHHLERLEKNEFIEWDREKKVITKRTVSIQTNTDFVLIPILGTANCGPAMIFADGYVEGHIKVSINLVRNKKNLFAVRAIGASMNMANIAGKNVEEGDFVIVDPVDKNIENNDYVLSVIDERANIKKVIINREYGQIALISESTYDYPPIFFDASESS